MQHITTYRFSPTWRRLLMPTLCVLSLLMLAATAPAQDTDDDGVLPTHTTGDQPVGSGGGGGSGSSSSSTVTTTVGITAAMDDDALDPEQASISLSSILGDTQLATEVDPEEATFVADTEGLTIQQMPNDVSIQGRGDLWLQANLAGTFRAPADSVVRMLVLILHDDTDSLDDVLSGDAQPQFIGILGSQSSFDLNFFQAVVLHHAADLPGISASLVYLSRDQGGDQHASAVRLSTSGGPIQVIID